MYFWQNPKVSYLMMETLLVQKVAYILAFFHEGEWFLYLPSVLRNELQMRKIIRLFHPFRARKLRIKKLTSFVGLNVAYKMLAQFMNPMALCSVSVVKSWDLNYNEN